MQTIAINMTKRHAKLKVPLIRKLIHAIFQRMECTQMHISVLLCDNATIQQMNRDFRGMDKPTDVLSFADEEASLFLGDIAISLEKIESQALEYSVSFEEEFKRILIHGILHLLGYHHEEDPKAEAQMLALQQSILEEVEQKPLCYPSSRN